MLCGHNSNLCIAFNDEWNRYSAMNGNFENINVVLLRSFLYVVQCVNDGP